MLIDRLGGAEALSQRFQSWGLTSTTIRNVLPDLEGTNTTSAEDMVKLMGLVTQGKLMSLRSRDRLLEIMRRTANNSLLPQGLGEGAIIAHKTGDIGTFVGDVGMIDMPSGKRYLAAVIVKGPHNDPRSTEMIRQFSRKVYQFFSK
jgi:beta-lactamase class A